MKLFLNEELGEITIEISKSINPTAVVILAHGAGAGMNHPFMTQLSSLLSNEGLLVIRFNFPYMEQGKKSTGAPKKNIETWKKMIEHALEKFPSLPVFLAGKSYGGRMASHLLTDFHLPEVKGIIYVGFPLHATGRDSMDRASHLDQIKIPQLFIQGTRDKLANIDMIREVLESLDKATLSEVDGGDHSFNVPKKIGVPKDGVMKHLAMETIDFIKKNS